MSRASAQADYCGFRNGSSRFAADLTHALAAGVPLETLRSLRTGFGLSHIGPRRETRPDPRNRPLHPRTFHETRRASPIAPGVRQVSREPGRQNDY